jgi:hypothetical protein
MNIELDEVVVQDVSDEALELAAGGEGGAFVGGTSQTRGSPSFCCATMGCDFK